MLAMLLMLFCIQLVAASWEVRVTRQVNVVISTRYVWSAAASVPATTFNATTLAVCAFTDILFAN